MRVKSIPLLLLLSCAVLMASCGRPERVTREDAEDLVAATFRDREPVYAEVPLRVTWSPSVPRDEFDERSITTLQRLEQIGLLSLVREGNESAGALEATVTPEGRRILGAVPSARGPAIRGRIAERRIDGVGEVELHPSEPAAARVEVLWHYASPTPLYDAFVTRQDKPLGEPFATIISMTWSEGAWRGQVIVRKTRPSSPGGSAYGFRPQSR